MFPDLSCFQLAREAAIWHITVIPCAFHSLPDMYTRVLGVHIRQTTHAHDTITTWKIYIAIYNYAGALLDGVICPSITSLSLHQI